MYSTLVLDQSALKKRGMDTPFYRSLHARLVAKSILSPTSGCLIWLGANNSKNGYVDVCQKAVGAHRVAYELYVGPIPEGLVISHLCGERYCIQPLHLEAVTRGECGRRTQKLRRKANERRPTA